MSLIQLKILFLGPEDFKFANLSLRLKPQLNLGTPHDNKIKCQSQLFWGFT